jgi:hypothetical protein
VTSTSAVVTYRAGGATKRVLASGAINARAPNGSGPQVKFRISTKAGKPVHGFRSSRFGVPLDTYGRNIYLDTLGSGYGGGWKRENSFLAHRPRRSLLLRGPPGRARTALPGHGHRPRGSPPTSCGKASRPEQRQMRDWLCRPN